MKRWRIWLVLVAIGLAIGIYTASNNSVNSSPTMIELPDSIDAKAD